MSFLSRPYVSFGWRPLCIHKSLSFYFSLYFEGSPPQQKITRELCSGGDRAKFLCSHVLMEQFWMGQIRKFKNTRRKGINQENSRKQEGSNGGKKEKRSVHTWRFPYWCVCHWLGMPSCYHTCATLHQENPLIWEPPLQYHKIGKKHCSSCPPHKSMHTSNNTSDSISVRSNYRKQLSYHL